MKDLVTNLDSRAPAARRWMVPDPLGEKYPAVNPYAYCAGDPVNYVEPSDLIILWGQFMRMAVPAVGWIMV